MGKEATKPARLTLLDISREYGSVAKIPENLILKRSDDKKTVLLHDGTKVSDEILREAVAESRRAEINQEKELDTQEALETFHRRLNIVSSGLTDQGNDIVELKSLVAALGKTVETQAKTIASLEAAVNDTSKKK